MSEIKHTPGPWSLTDRRFGGVIKAGPVQHWANGSGQSQIVMCCGADWMKDGELDANGKLISAAPELYDACIQARALLHTMMADLKDPAAISVVGRKIETISSALTKATE